MELTKWELGARNPKTCRLTSDPVEGLGTLSRGRSLLSIVKPLSQSRVSLGTGLVGRGSHQRPPDPTLIFTNRLGSVASILVLLSITSVMVQMAILADLNLGLGDGSAFLPAHCRQPVELTAVSDISDHRSETKTVSDGVLEVRSCPPPPPLYFQQCLEVFDEAGSRFCLGRTLSLSEQTCSGK
ncbi:hypothetical protein CRG98_024146 [Punica granatum]|uniref:Uncharacterized protein n=1 Tax=Punica granatum TaxID=22663 RepID=A0A2I0JGZ6_PUNGR|nr:hypothetical protein CRG98_024146 [Punica granatum]